MYTCSIPNQAKVLQELLGTLGKLVRENTHIRCERGDPLFNFRDRGRSVGFF